MPDLKGSHVAALMHSQFCNFSTKLQAIKNLEEDAAQCNDIKILQNLKKAMSCSLWDELKEKNHLFTTAEKLELLRTLVFYGTSSSLSVRKDLVLGNIPVVP